MVGRVIKTINFDTPLINYSLFIKIAGQNQSKIRYLKRSNTTIENQQSIEELNPLIIDAIQDIKGINIVQLDLRNLAEAPADYFIICEGESNTQVSAIAGNVIKRVKDELGVIPTHREGVNNARWVLVDYFNTVLHVFYPETRKFYELEDLWSDAEFTEYDNL